MNTNDFAYRLLTWYPDNCRDLPWRKTDDPYIIWLSEIILQQTKVAQGLPYFMVFSETFPDVKSLAEAPLSLVMRCWQGLGYYSRARNLHACAQQVVHDWGGNFPDSYRDLLKLKGVGPYTAAAIASFAFGEKVAVVDGNVYRVLSRFFGVDADISTQKGKKEFEKLANQLIATSDPGTYNQAIMEFGALQCVPKSPDCHSCPLVENCHAFSANRVQDYPVKTKKVKIKKRYFSYLHITCAGYTVVKERGAGDIWQGLVDFPLDEFKNEKQNQWEDGESLASLRGFSRSQIDVFGTTYKHILSHQWIFATFVQVRLQKGDLEILRNWVEDRNYLLVNGEELEDLGKPILIAKYLIDCD
ncbi:A/G-specific adenine glycosylase [Pleomorphovibrio marinus]|uniref:A/G-specific adenine glycosylase n=1 Tax=Pleomorphovibrio marinus TaxID=2164132 RepID=UPI000E0C8864|nr:A/G-specific adenine glycosylase [Pleomorphovibrio marinus]